MSQQPARAKIARDIACKVPVMQETATLAEVVAELGNFSSGVVALVSPAGTLTGAVTCHDVVLAFAKGITLSTRVSSVMTRSPFWVAGTTPIENCADIMRSKRVQHLMMFESGKVTGVVLSGDCMAVLTDRLATIAEDHNRGKEQLRQRDEFLAMAAHDIRSPIAVIASCTHLIRDQLYEENTAPNLIVVELLERIEANAAASTKLVEDILDLGRLGAGVRLNYREVGVDPWLMALVENLQFRANDKQVMLKLDCELNLVATLDPDRLAQAIDNLVNNAIKFSPNGSQVYITAKHKPSASRGERGDLIISIRDEGPGIEESQVKKLFSRYQQLQSSGPGSGVGLGLSIAAQFVAVHQGTLTVDGGFGKGATFSVVVPGCVKQETRQDNINPATFTVMVVDDDPDLREIHADLLRAEGWNVVLASNGRDALSALKTQKVDLIYSDIRMPHIDGIELLTIVKRNNPKMPFFLTSGAFPGMMDKLAGTSMKADGFFEKPVPSETIVTAIREVFERLTAAEKKSA